MANNRKYSTAQVAREIGAHRNTVARWATGECPAGFPLATPLRRTSTGKLLLHPAELARLSAWVASTIAGNRGKARADVLRAAAVAKTARGRASQRKARAAARAAQDDARAARERRERRQGRPASTLQEMLAAILRVVPHGPRVAAEVRGLDALPAPERARRVLEVEQRYMVVIGNH